MTNRYLRATRGTLKKEVNCTQTSPFNKYFLVQHFMYVWPHDTQHNNIQMKTVLDLPMLVHMSTMPCTHAHSFQPIHTTSSPTDQSSMRFLKEEVNCTKSSLSIGISWFYISCIYGITTLNLMTLRRMTLSLLTYPTCCLRNKLP